MGCRKSGTGYSCNANCNYDLCKVCYKAQKKKTRAKLKEWLEKHPDDPDNKKKEKDEDEDDDAKKEDSQSEAGEKSKKESEAESDANPSTEDQDKEDKDDTGAEDGEKKE